MATLKMPSLDRPTIRRFLGLKGTPQETVQALHEQKRGASPAGLDRVYGGYLDYKRRLEQKAKG